MYLLVAFGLEALFIAFPMDRGVGGVHADVRIMGHQQK